MASPRGKLNKGDASKITKGAGVGLGGLLLTSLVNAGGEYIGTGQLGPTWTPIAVVGFGVLANTLRKLWSKPRE